MENWLVTILVIAGLLVGGIGGAAWFPTTVTVTKEVEVIKEVLVEVPAEETIVEIPAPNLLDLAVTDFMRFVEDEEDDAGEECDLLEGYDFEEVSVRKVYDKYTIAYDEDEHDINFTIKLKYKEEGEASEKSKYDVSMHYEVDEDTEITSVEKWNATDDTKPKEVICLKE